MQGEPIEVEAIAKVLAKISTISNSGVQAVFSDIVGVKFLDDFNFDKQVKAVCSEFIPECVKLSNGTYICILVDREEPEWIGLATTTKDTTLGGEDGGDGDLKENPLGESCN